MRLPHYLHRAPSGIWHFRQRVPTHLIPVFGKQVLKQSLRTRNVLSVHGRPLIDFVIEFHALVGTRKAKPTPSLGPEEPKAPGIKRRLCLGRIAPLIHRKRGRPQQNCDLNRSVVRTASPGQSSPNGAGDGRRKVRCHCMGKGVGLPTG